MFSKTGSFSFVFLSGHFFGILNFVFHPLSILEVMFQQKHEVVGEAEAEAEEVGMHLFRVFGTGQ